MKRKEKQTTTNNGNTSAPNRSTIIARTEARIRIPKLGKQRGSKSTPYPRQKNLEKGTMWNHDVAFPRVESGQADGIVQKNRIPIV
jgi:hypothetical protein